MSNKLFPLLDDKQQRGSKPRCHLLTCGDADLVSRRLTELVTPHAEIRPEDRWLPKGFDCIEEARLGETPELVSDDQRDQLLAWWLEVRERANTPNWDIASTALVIGRAGLVLVEAKAHEAELSRSGKVTSEKTSQSGLKNHEKIGRAIEQANGCLNQLKVGWNLSRDSHYQLANRFAWGWKLASMGVPVVLVYLGFLGADDMAAPYVPLRDHEHWKDAVLEYSRDIVPVDVWETPIKIGDVQLIPLIRSLRVNLPQ